MTTEQCTDGGPCENTDRHLWPPTAKYDAPHESIHVTAQGGIGINVAGCVYVKTLREWHNLAGGTEAFSIRNRCSNERLKLDGYRDLVKMGSSVGVGGAALATLLDEIERLRGELLKYGRHEHPNCHDLTLNADGSFGPRNGCLCGFDAAKAGLPDETECCRVCEGPMPPLSDPPWISPICPKCDEKAARGLCVWCEHPLRHETTSPQAPIACVRIVNDMPVVTTLYAPGLPDGEHDLYCEPPAPGGQKVPHPAFETEEELSPRDHALIDEAFKRHVGKTCNRPPIGWSCSREVGHDGPCAASPLKTSEWPVTKQIEEAGSPDRLQMGVDVMNELLVEKTSTPSTHPAPSVDKTAEDRQIDAHHCETCVCPEQAEFKDLPESLRDPIKVMERGRELLKDWPAQFGNGLGARVGKKFSFSFPTEEEAERAFRKAAELFGLETSPPSDKCEHGIPRRFCTAVHDEANEGQCDAMSPGSDWASKQCDKVRGHVGPHVATRYGVTDKWAAEKTEVGRNHDPSGADRSGLRPDLRAQDQQLSENGKGD